MLSLGEALKFEQQLRWRLQIVGIFWDTIRYGTKQRTLRLIKMTDTLGTQRRVNFINQLAHINRIVGAKWLADIAVDTFIGDY